MVGATDIGLPLSEPGQVALLPTNVAAFGAGLEQSDTDVTLYLALRECARQRLFASAGWLREQMLALVEQYASGITIDTSALEEAVGRIDPQNLEELSSTLEGGLFEPQKTPEQQATLERLETMLALVEGWVDDVVTQATAPWMPAAAALAETVRRARATGGPAEATFATLVGLELRPRRMRDAANLWAALREARGIDGRDAVWSHPDLLPTSADLDDPLGFVAAAKEKPASDAEFDAALAELLTEADAGAARRAMKVASPAPTRSERPAHLRLPANAYDLVARRWRAGAAAPAVPRPPEQPGRRVVERLPRCPSHGQLADLCTRRRSRCSSPCTRELGRWLQTGGHIEPEDASLEAAALREAGEESGLADLELDPVTAAAVPARGALRSGRALLSPRRAVSDPDRLGVATASFGARVGRRALVRLRRPADTDESVRELVSAAAAQRLPLIRVDGSASAGQGR